MAFALRREMGEALANGMADAGPEDRTVVVAAAEAYGFDEVATELQTITRREVRYAPVTDDEYVAQAAGAGLPPEVARRFLGSYSDIRHDQLGETSGDLEALLGRPSASLRAGLTEVFGPSGQGRG